MVEWRGDGVRSNTSSSSQTEAVDVSLQQGTEGSGPTEPFCFTHRYTHHLGTIPADIREANTAYFLVIPTQQSHGLRPDPILHFLLFLLS